MLTNLLEETKYVMEQEKLSSEDIVFMGSTNGEYETTWEEFQTLANFDYDSGFGCNYVALDFYIRFKCGGIIVREEYDGSEYWQFFPNKRIDNPKKIRNLKTYSLVSW